MIYLDMDGVLADFDGGLAEHGIKNDVWFIHKPKSEWTPEQVELDKEVVRIMKIPGFFRNLKPMPGAEKLWGWAAVYKGMPSVLTARPKADGERVTQEKRGWIEDHFGPIPDERFVCCLREEKKNYAEYEYAGRRYPALLVDDLMANCQDWATAGGRSVWFRSAEEAIRELDNLVEF